MMEKIFSAIGKSITFLVMLSILGLPVAMMVGLPIMLALGSLHNDVSPTIPALGYWATVIVMWGFGIIASYLRPAKS